MRRRQFTAALGGLPMAATVAPRAFAQGDDWPTRSVRIVCPFTAGGSQDNIARRLGAKLGDYLGQSFVIDNRTGAGGSIAADNVAKSPPTAIRSCWAASAATRWCRISMPKPAYNAFTDLETVVWIGTQPNLLCCHPSFPYDTVPKLVEAAKKDPGKYSYGSSGMGTSPTLTMELFKQRTGADLTFISYRGAAMAAADVLAGHLPLCIANIDSLMGQVSAGKLKADRLDPAPSARRWRPTRRTFVEAGYPDLIVTSWSMWAVPAGTPAKPKEKLKAANERALQDPEVIASMRQGGFEPGSMPLAQVDEFVKEEYKRWGEVIRAAGIKPE